MNEPQKHYVVKPESKDYISYDSMYIKHLEKINNIGDRNQIKACLGLGVEAGF